ncbi:hypothetical protein Q4I32_003462 [Leishmania shawi]|uniref:Transmembrane protein n=1 Tax=Leishmania shawi TaxID=5680 RepID=A0AAW3BTN1_9TRYP
MDAAETGNTDVVELVSDHYFPSDTNEAAYQQQQLRGNGNRDGGPSTQLGLTSTSGQELEGYIYSDAAVLDLQSHAWISVPSAAVRRRRWRLVNCMWEQNPPIAITITDLSLSVKPTQESLWVVPQEANASTTDALQQDSSFLQVPHEKASAKAGESLRDEHVVTDGSVAAKDSHPLVMAPGSAGSWNITKWRLADAPYLHRGFTSDVFPSECRQLLEDLPMGTQMEDWSMFVVAATLSFYQRQAHEWATSWWTWCAELSGRGGILLPGWLTAPSAGATVDGNLLSVAGSVTTTATAAASAVLAPLLSVLYALSCLLRAGHHALAQLLSYETLLTLPAKDSIMWSLVTNDLWRLQMELMLLSIAFILLFVCVLVVMRYRKYTETLESWEAEMTRHNAAEVAKWAAEMDLRQRVVRTTTSAGVATGEPSTHANASGDSSSGLFKAPARASSASLSGCGSLRREPLAEMPREVLDSVSKCQDGSLWYVDSEGAASIVSSQRQLRESSDSGTSDASMPQFSGELLQDSFRGCGATADGGVDVVGGNATKPVRVSASLFLTEQEPSVATGDEWVVAGGSR